MSKINIPLMTLLWVSYPQITEAQVCTASIESGIAFGDVDPSGSTSNTSTGTLTINCTAIGTQTVTYTARLIATGANAQRSMNGPGGNPLKYNLYTKPAGTTVWGDGSSGTGVFSGGGTCQGNCTFIHTIYGQLPLPQSDTPIGPYSDMMTATVDYEIN